jgi:hypothetical protein
VYVVQCIHRQCLSWCSVYPPSMYWVVYMYAVQCIHRLCLLCGSVYPQGLCMMLQGTVCDDSRLLVRKYLWWLMLNTHSRRKIKFWTKKGGESGGGVGVGRSLYWSLYLYIGNHTREEGGGCGPSNGNAWNAHTRMLFSVCTPPPPSKGTHSMQQFLSRIPMIAVR